MHGRRRRNCKWLSVLVVLCFAAAAEAWENGDSDPDVPEMLDAYKDSYITKAQAKKFLKRMQSYRDTHSDTEFKHFLDEIAFKPVKSDVDNEFYDKKYFDYLPSDESAKQQAGDDGVEMAPKALKQRENHRRLKRQTVDYFFFTDHDPSRYYLPARPDNSYLPPRVMRPDPNIGNRGFFDLQDNFIFDYVYDPLKSTGFGAPPPMPSRPIFGTFPRPAPDRSFTTTTRRPWNPPKAFLPASAPESPNNVIPGPVASPPIRPARPSFDGGFPTTTVVPLNPKTTEAPSVFQASDYEDDLDDEQPLTSRFGEEVKDPNKCSWATTNCCPAASQSKRERCFQIFRCSAPIERACTPDNVLRATIKTANFLNSARKKK